MEAPQRKRYRVVLGCVFRSIYSALYVIINYFIFFQVPNIVFQNVGRLTLDLGGTITAYFIAIEALTVAHIMLKDHIVGSISAASLGLVEAAYIYNITYGGTFTTTLSGISVTLGFKPLVYLIMAIPLLGVVKQVHGMIHKSSSQPITMIETAG